MSHPSIVRVYDAGDPSNTDSSSDEPPYIVMELISGTLRGMGNTLVPTIITAFGICVLRVLWMFTVVPAWHEILAITISYPISWVATASAFFIYYRKVSQRYLPKIKA